MITFPGIQGPALLPRRTIPHPPLTPRQNPHKAITPIDNRQTVDKLEEESKRMKEIVKRLYEATIPIFENGQYVGNSVAISDSLLLTSANCGSGHSFQMLTPNGVQSSLSIAFESPETGFKILSVDSLLFIPFGSLQSMALGGIVNSKESFQVRFDPVTKEKKVRRIANQVDNQNPHISPLLSPRIQRRPLNYTDLPNTTEQGAPVMALENGKVYAIRYDVNTSIPTFDIYAKLQEAAIQEKNLVAKVILKQIGLFDCQYTKSIVIPIDVDPATGKKEIDPQTGNKRLFFQSGIYGFAKADYGTTLKIWPPDKLYECRTYEITPLSENPEEFASLAEYVGREWLRTKQPPKKLTVRISGISYSLTLSSDIPYSSHFSRKKREVLYSPRHHRSPLHSPRATPMHSPRVTPLNSPRSTPKHSPLMSPIPSPRNQAMPVLHIDETQEGKQPDS